MQSAPSPGAHHDGPPCPGCRTTLPPEAMYCVECGLCMLDVTTEGTVIAGPTVPGEPADEDVADGVPTLAELIAELGQQLETTPANDIPRAARWPTDRYRAALGRERITLVNGGPIEPRAFWDAPPPGDTVVAPPPGSR